MVIAGPTALMTCARRARVSEHAAHVGACSETMSDSSVASCCRKPQIRCVVRSRARSTRTRRRTTSARALWQRVVAGRPEGRRRRAEARSRRPLGRRLGGLVPAAAAFARPRAGILGWAGHGLAGTLQGSSAALRQHSRRMPRTPHCLCNARARCHTLFAPPSHDGLWRNA